MKHLFSFTLMLVTVAMMHSSCKKCTECTVYNKNGEIDSALEDVEFCGKEADLEEAEANMHAYADSIQGTAECFR